MNITQLVLTPVQISGTEDADGILLGVQNLYEYQNQQKTNKIIGFTADVVFPLRQYNKEKVKVQGSMETMPMLQERLNAANGNGLKCRCNNLRGKFYFSPSDKTYKLSATADGIELLNP